MMSNSPHLAALPAVAAAVLLLLAGCSGGGPPSLLQSRVEASFEVTAAVTYEMAFDLGGTGNPNPVSTTIIQGPWGRRSDAYFSTATQTYSGSSLDLGDEQYICGRYTGLEPENLPEGQVEAWEDGVCYSGESLGDTTDEALGYAVDFTFSFRETLSESDLELVGTSTREVAGIWADCFEVTSTEPQPEEVEVCFSEDGILLSAEVTSPQASISALAVKVSREVQEEDFRLPYPVVPAP